VTRLRGVTGFLSALIVLGCAAAAQQPSARTVPADRVSAPMESWVDSVLATMSLRDKAAQMVWPQILGDFVPGDAPLWERATRFVTDEKVGGFIISVGSPTEIASKTNALQRLSALPLLFGADFEFGAGYRARGGYFLPNAIDLGGAVIFPPQMALGATGDEQLAYDQGRVTAVEGRALGVHVAYAPVLDVNNNPANPVISTRSYGSDPELVGRMGVAFVRGLQEHGMIATGKHFPGHGDTEVNSHLALPVVAVSRARLDSLELPPFRQAVRAGVGAIMTFHGAMPALDSTLAPGTLSKQVLTGLLRGEMGFEGLIISDAMDMRGVLDHYGPVEAAILAVEAGSDILIQPLDVRETIDAVVSGVERGRYDEVRLDESVRRILEAKVRMGVHRQPLVDVEAVREHVGRAGHTELAAAAAERSITLVKDSLAQLPLRANANTRVLSITLARRPDLAAGEAFNAELRTAFPRLRVEWVNPDARDDAWQRLLRAADSADVVVVSPYIAHRWDAVSVAAPQAFAEFMRTLVERDKRPIVVNMGNPYLLQQIPEVPAYLVAWGGFPVSQRAAARALLGRAPITGRLPIEIPPLAPLGAGHIRFVVHRLDP
jgi:beta-N-acetylhexosaminidase